MKKFLLFSVIALLVGCIDYMDDFNAIDERLDKLEQKIPTIDEQVSSIQESINALEEVDSKLKESIKVLEASDKATAEEIAALKEADKAIEAKIEELKKYVDDALKSTKDWVNATFATLEQLNALSSEVATLKNLVEANKAEAAANLANAISNLETSLKKWVGEQLSNYYTIAEIDAKIAELQKAITDGDSALQQQLNELKSQLETTKSEVTEAYKKAIKEAIETNNGVINAKIAEEIGKVNSLIEGLNSKLAQLQIQVDKNTEDIAKLLARIQSVSYIPTYSDGKATLEYTGNESKVTLDFEISPKDAIAELVKVWDSTISVKAVYTQTRAVEFIDMPITKFDADTEKGVITVTASGENLSEEFFTGEQEASVALAISDGNNSVISEYIQMVLNDLTPKVLTIVADKTIIYNDGIDCATFTVYYNDTILENGYNLFVNEDCLEGNKFCSTVKGTFEIWAAYGTVISNTVNINVVATPPPAPTAPQDTNPSKTNFIRRILLTQFLGTGCGYDPLMINAMHQIQTDEHYNNKVVITAAHLYNESDPAFLSEAKTLVNALSVQGFPSVYADLNKSALADASYASLTSTINKAKNRVSVKGGIAVSSKYYAEEGYIVLNATVKAKESGEFRVGAWLLEDGIEGKQSVYADPYAGTGELIQPLEGVNFNLHNNCVRLAESKYSNSNYSGYSLGTIEAGKTASREFAFKLKDNGKGSKNAWNHDNLRVIVFITTEENGKWYVNNVVKCPKDGSVDFEYEN